MAHWFWNDISHVTTPDCQPVETCLCTFKEWLGDWLATGVAFLSFSLFLPLLCFFLVFPRFYSWFLSPSLFLCALLVCNLPPRSAPIAAWKWLYAFLRDSGNATCIFFSPTLLYNINNHSLPLHYLLVNETLIYHKIKYSAFCLKDKKCKNNSYRIKT